MKIAWGLGGGFLSLHLSFSIFYLGHGYDILHDSSSCKYSQFGRRELLL